MKIFEEARETKLRHVTRRHFLKDCTTGLGGMALLSMFGGKLPGAKASTPGVLGGAHPLAPRAPHFAPKVKNIIYLHMAGSPSQLELFDYKPKLHELDGLDCPESLLEGRRFAFIQGTPKMMGPRATFQQHGESGAYVSDKLPFISKSVDDLTFLKAVHTDQFNHAPAQLLLYSGSPRLGRPSMGSWVTYGLGSENENLPGFVVLVSGGITPSAGKSVWGSGFLPTVYQGVQCRSKGDPVLYASDPKGVSRDLRRRSIDAINEINQKSYEEIGDPEILSRISQYEMAFKMQMSVPEAMDIHDEPEYIKQMYGVEPGAESYANNCLLARRLVERGVRFVQLFHWGWDSHGATKNEALGHGFLDRCKETDKATWALINDLKQRGLLENTLVVWGGEFGRTPMRENRGGKTMQYEGRDHHTEAFTIFMAGGGLKQGFTYGETDDLGYFPTKERVHVHDLQATMLHLLGLDHERLTYHFQGREFRLTDVHGHVVKNILA